MQIMAGAARACVLGATVLGATVLGATVLAATVLVACTGDGVGDVCLPEQVPDDGFDPQEVYLETSSVQCRTRACLVYRLDGDPRTLDDATLENRAFCSCRCSGEQGSNLPLCDCGDGFRCLEPDDRGFVSTGPDAVRGGYCVPCIRADEERALDPTVFERCDAS